MLTEITRVEIERAFKTKDARYDGMFFVAVRTTGIFCLPSCAARPKRENVEFFTSARKAQLAGYRPCKRCRPLEWNGSSSRGTSALAEAFEALTKSSGGQSVRRAKHVAAQFIESPLGPILAAATRQGVCMLEFAERAKLEQHYRALCNEFHLPIVLATNDALEQLCVELGAYFAGKRKQFRVPLAMGGTPFQQKVWRALCEIPFGETTWYGALAAQIGKPTAVRAVARANGTNRISIVIPCHRVLGKDGELTGYGGGLWRKRLLLELEQTGHLPDGKVVE